MKKDDKPKVKVQLLKDWTDADGAVHTAGTVVSVESDLAEAIYAGGYANPPGGRPAAAAKDKAKD